MQELWKSAVFQAFSGFSEKFNQFLPNLLALVTIIVVGVIIAFVLKFLLKRFLLAVRFDTFSERWGLTLMLSRGGWTRPVSQLISLLLFWILVFFSLIIGISALDLTATRTLTSNIFLFLPHALAAAIILIVGYLLGNFLGRAVLVAAVNAQIKSALAISRLVRAFVIILAVSMAVVQLGIGRELVVAAFSIFFGGVVLALALAFGLGGKDLARDFLERKFGRARDEEEGKGDPFSHI